MTPEQARSMHLACDFLYAYVAHDGQDVVPNAEQFVELTDGNYLAADALAGMLAKLFGKTFDQVLDELVERDEGCPPDSVAKPLWDDTVEQLKYLHDREWEARPEPPGSSELSRAFRSSFNLVVALNCAFATATQNPPSQTAGILRDAAAGEM